MSTSINDGFTSISSAFSGSDTINTTVNISNISIAEEGGLSQEVVNPFFKVNDFVVKRMVGYTPKGFNNMRVNPVGNQLLLFYTSPNLDPNDTVERDTTGDPTYNDPRLLSFEYDSSATAAENAYIILRVNAQRYGTSIGDQTGGSSGEEMLFDIGLNTQQNGNNASIYRPTIDTRILNVVTHQQLNCPGGTTSFAGAATQIQSCLGGTNAAATTDVGGGASLIYGRKIDIDNLRVANTNLTNVFFVIGGQGASADDGVFAGGDETTGIKLTIDYVRWSDVYTNF